MSCILPQCNCIRYKKCGDDKTKSSIIQLNIKCSTCGHTQDLHRKRNAKDNLIIGELMSASSNRCSSVIPMSELHQMSMFESYSPIPIPPDDITNEDGSVLCTCTGFSAKELSDILHTFNKFSYDNVHERLPLVNCSSCTHTLLMHQSSHTIPNEIKSVTTIPSPYCMIHNTLLSVLMCDSHVTLSALWLDGKTWRLACKSYEEEVSEEGYDNKRRSKRNSSKRPREVHEDKLREEDKMSVFIKESLNRESTVVLNELVSPQHLSSTQLVNDHLIAIAEIDKISLFLLPDIKTGSHDIPSLSHEIKYTGSLTLLSLSPPPASVGGESVLICLGFSSGDITIWKITSEDVHSLTSISISDSSVTHCVWVLDQIYLTLGTQKGELVFYSLKDSVIKYRMSCTSGPVTSLCWINELRSVAMASADGCVHIINISSDKTSNNAPILKYFTTQESQRDRFRYIAILKAHRSFVGASDATHNELITIGWDGLMICWSLSQISFVLQHDLHKKYPQPLGETPSDIEPTACYKIGPQSCVNALPIGLWSNNNTLLTVFRERDNKINFIIYS